MDEKAGNLSRTPTYEELATKVKELEEELKLTQKKESLPGRDDCAGQTCARLMRRMLDNAPDLIWAKDMEDRYLFANKGICRKLLKCGSNNEAVGKTDLFFAMRERAGGYEHTFGEICLDSDAIVKETSTPERFLEYGLVKR